MSTTSTIENVAAIQNIYAAFGRADVPAILAAVRPDTKWDFAGARPEVPWHVPVKSAADLPSFFGALMQNVQMTRFEPREVVHCGPHVMVEVSIEYTVTKTGRRVAMDQIHWWTLEGGKVTRLRHFEDTAQVAAALAA
jgi:ketosteroid isomerase-like protein